jgi:hypothetical protein
VPLLSGETRLEGPDFLKTQDYFMDDFNNQEKNGNKISIPNSSSIRSAMTTLQQEK